MDVVVATRENGGLEFIFSQAKREGWNPGLCDLSIYSSIDPKGLFVGVIDGTIIGCISGIRLDECYGFVGYYIILPEMRGRSYGIQLFRHAMRYLGDRNVGLDAVPAQVHNYIKSGFMTYHISRRYRGFCRAQASTPVDGRLVLLSSIHFPYVLQYVGVVI